MKQLTGGSPIAGEKKFKDPFPFVSYAKLIFACNVVPPCPDNTDAFFRRWLQVAFMRQFLEGDPNRDETLKAYIRDDPQCHEAILAWAIEGLKRLLANKGHFTFTKSMGETRKQYERSTNPTLAFVQDNLVQNMEKHIDKLHLYRCLKNYCERFKLPTPNSGTFATKLQELNEPRFTAEHVWNNETKTKVVYWQGVTFNDESPYSDSTSVCEDKNCIPLIAKEKDIIKNKSDISGHKGILKNEHTHTGNSDTLCTEYSEQNIPPIKYSDQNTTGKDLLNKKKEEEITSFREFTDEDAPFHNHKCPLQWIFNTWFAEYAKRKLNLM
jgi:phage/plasmid-associated DNA primase